MSELFTGIREAAADVARNARFVHLLEDQIASYAASLSLRGLPAPEYDREHHYTGSPADTAAFLLALDSVNFGSGYFPHLQKRPGMSGYFTIATSLKERWEQTGPLTTAELRGMTDGDCAALFGQSLSDPAIAELMAHFAQTLRDLGEWLAGYDDDPLAAIAASGGSAAALVADLARMPLFRDVALYNGRAVPLYKRGQLLAADLALAFDHTGPGAFHDLDDLTIFADNLVPHVLRLDGLLAYDPSLLARIERGDLIAAGSPEEVEIRAVALHAVERVVAAMRANGVSATARELDYLLWHRGQDPRIKAHPRHRARSVFY
ncbi:MAG: queuosine salvage family protein [Thermomicrobiales bacterium]